MLLSVVTAGAEGGRGRGKGSMGRTLHIMAVVALALSALFLCSFCNPLLLGLSYRGSVRWLIDGSCLAVDSSGSRQWVSPFLPPRPPLSSSPHTPLTLTCSYWDSMGCPHSSVGPKANVFLFMEVSKKFCSTRQVLTVLYWV